ncbi:ParM/StbA family protein [Okeania sp. KiyG1]|uniref:ParM/StbA family protein n=1 Tax=Okeania sp. KiyG1 TaxID=2720165 RepID=UPI0019220920|nr:ParM/StbA family protein [Okeania sp. KiyG1]GGA57257.1 hypothetical protein CYANOKiyG1_78300 [Okeania sp. KiyG1]
MGSEIANVSRSSIEILEKETFSNYGEPEHRAWCGVKDAHYKVIGSLAEKFSGFTLLKPPKYELAIFKTLALLWVIKEKWNLPSKFAIYFGLLIPPGEYNDRFELEKLLKQACQSFNTPSGEMSVTLEDFDCKPESAGITLYLKNNPKYRFNQQNFSVVMLGYRNASLITFKRGQPINKYSSDLGMNFMIEKFRNFTCKKNPVSELLPIIVAANSDLENANTYLNKLIDTTFINNTVSQLQRLKDGLHLSRAEYFEALKNWLLEFIPFDNNIVVFCGGTAEFLRSEIHYFNGTRNNEMFIFDGIKPPNRIDRYSLKERIYDLYCYYLYYLPT